MGICYTFSMNPVDLWNRAYLKKNAVPSFNFSGADVALTIARTVKRLGYYCLISTSETELNFQTPSLVVSIAKALQESGYPVFLNLDHGKSSEIIRRAIDLGFDCIHFDGSDLSLEENITRTKEIVEICRPRGISVEGEVGKIGGSSTLQDESGKTSELTKPEEAIRFAKETQVDILACSFGSAHGLSKEPEILDISILEEIRKHVDVPFVLHGGSGLPQTEIKKAISAGVVKINFNTELRMAWTEGIKEYLNQNSQDIVPVNILTHADLKVEKVVEEKVRMCINSE